MFLILTTLTGCSGAFTDEDKARKLVAKYVSVLPIAYREGRFEGLLTVANGNALSKVDNAYNAYRNGNGMVLESLMLELEFTNIEVGSGRDDVSVEVIYDEEKKEWYEQFIAKETFVKTVELWQYKWINYDDKTPASPFYTMRYEVLYTLEYLEPELKISNVQILKVTPVSEEDTGADWKGNSAGQMSVH